MNERSVLPLREFAEELASGVQAPSEAVCLRVLDGVAAYVLGSVTEEGMAVSRLIGRLAGEVDRVVWSGGILDDVFARVSIARLTECDDIHSPSGTTPGSVTVPVAVTVGAHLHATGEELSRAVASGYEAMARLGLAAGGPRCAERGIWATYLGAGFAAAATTSVLLRLDVERTYQALNLALTRAAWVAASSGGGMPLSRWLTVGEAARSGCIAAFAALEGFQTKLDLERFAAITGVILDFSALCSSTNAITESSVKPFPIAKQALAAVEAARRLANRVTLSTVRAVRVFVTEPCLDVTGRDPHVDSRLSRISSVRWNVALALGCGGGLYDVERANPPLVEPRLARLAELVMVQADRELLNYYPKWWPARVEIETEDGTFEELVVEAPGDFNSIDLTWKVIEEKWKRLVTETVFASLKAAAEEATLRSGALIRLDSLIRSLSVSGHDAI